MGTSDVNLYRKVALTTRIGRQCLIGEFFKFYYSEVAYMELLRISSCGTRES